MRVGSPRRLIAGICAALTLPLALAACAADEPSPAASAPAAPADVPAGVLVHLFQWPWADVAAECTRTLGPAGIAGVQISPPQEHVVLPDASGTRYPWWQDYQPVSYTVGGRRGDRAAFAAMVRTCHTAGVKVYADAVVNHMSAQDAGTGSAGTAFTRYGYPGLYADADFHSCRTDITDYNDRAQVQGCRLVGLSDLATELPSVRARITAYLDDLLSLGVDGFRIDAAKHMPAQDVRAILAGLSRPAQVYSEVLYTPAEPIQATEYRDFGATLEPRYAETVARAFRNGSPGLLDRLGEQTGSAFTDLLPSAGTVVYVDSHDSQRGTRTLSYKDGALHTQATQFMLAWPYGTPLLMSSFAFDSYDAGPPADATGRTLPVVCDGKAFVCEHRLPGVLAMVAFRRAVGDAPVSHWWATAGQLGFTRMNAGGRGYFALNLALTPATRTVDTGLPGGDYRDLLSDATVTVDGSGQAALTIPAGGALALLPM